MRRIFRDNWAWRGGLALDELRYVPEPVELHGGQAVAWPFLVSVTDVVALLCTRDAPGTTTTAAAAALCLLAERADGLHARLTAAMLPELAAQHAALLEAAGRTGVVADFATAVDALCAVGVVGRTGNDVVLLRPPDPSPDALLACRAHMDEVARRTENHELDRLLTRLVRRVEADGAGARRFRELSDDGRLRITVTATPASSNPDGLFDVGPNALPSLDLVLNPHGGVHALRGWIGAGGMVHEGDRGPDSLILLAAYEVAALVLGSGVGPNALRRATRASGLWVQLLDQTEGRTGGFETSVSSVATRLGGLLGLAPTGDHRALATALLEDLERAGAIRTDRPSRKTLRLELLHPEPPADATVAHFVRQWAAWRLSGEQDPASGLGGVLPLAREHLRRSRRRWERLLEARCVRVEVLPGTMLAGPLRALPAERSRPPAPLRARPR